MINIGIICPSEIAFRRFLPALQKAKKDFKFVGIAIAGPEEWFEDISNVSKENIRQQQQNEKSKAQKFVDSYGGKIFDSYQSILQSSELDAIYIPLPPALHYKWAKLALENGKHVFVEKPSTICSEETSELIALAKKQKMALHENYMFIFHDQLKVINEVVNSGEIGYVSLYRISFGFPRREKNDFRYNEKLGGGALLDAGGYTIKYATHLLGKTAQVMAAASNYIPDFKVDIFGTATMINDEGLTAQLAFGMDNNYKCDIEVWGSKGTIISNRILTAPVDFVPTYIINKNQKSETRLLPSDDAFYKSILWFKDCIYNDSCRLENYSTIQKQSDLVEQFKQKSQNQK